VEKEVSKKVSQVRKYEPVSLDVIRTKRRNFYFPFTAFHTT